MFIGLTAETGVCKKGLAGLEKFKDDYISELFIDKLLFSNSEEMQ